MRGVGWGIDPAVQRRGLARHVRASVLDDACAGRGGARLVAIADPENLASRTLTERLGFAIDGQIQASGTVQPRYQLTRESYLAAGRRP